MVYHQEGGHDVKRWAGRQIIRRVGGDAAGDPFRSNTETAYRQ